MSLNLRALAASDLTTTLEGDWELTADFKFPDGTTQDDVPAQIFWNDFEFNPQTGEPMIGRVYAVTVVLASLNYTPVKGDDVLIRIPTDNSAGTIIDTLSTATRPPKENSIGWVTFYPQLAEQSS